MNKNRLEAFSDGVFAIAITLLVLGVRIPDTEVRANYELTAILVGMIPSIVTFVFTFFVVGVFWVAHHRIFNLTKSVDISLLWQNIAYLMTIALIPVPAALLARHPFLQTAILFYATTLFLASSQHFLFLAHIYRVRELRASYFTEGYYLTARRTASVGPLCYFAAAVASIVSPYVSFALILMALFFYMFVGNRVRIFDARRGRGARRR